MSFRREKVCSLLQNTATSFISREFAAAPSILVSVTKVEVSSDLKKAKIFVSIYPIEKEKEALEALKNRLSDLRNYVKSQIKMKFLPFFEIDIDRGEKSRQRIEEILRK